VLDDRAVERVRAGLAATGLGSPATTGTGAPGDAAASGGATKGLGSALVKLGLLSALVAGALALAVRSGTPTPAAAPSPSASTPVPSTEAPAASSPPAPLPEPSVEPSPTAPAQRSARAAPRPAPSASLPAASAAAPSPREGLLLLRARQVLEADPARALELLAQHEREFPKSQLAPERATLRRQAEGRLAR
jgi:hypothetical protein